jgi:ribosomal protein S6--L-glutamate ligase
MATADDSIPSQIAPFQKKRTVVALEKRLRNCRNVITLGVKPNFNDYSTQDATLIRESEKIYYPSLHYIELFKAMGKKTFPRYVNYVFAQDKIKQTTLFQLLKIPHPYTRFFFGNRQKSRILNYFSLPFIAKIPRGSALGRGVFLIKTPSDLEQYCSLSHIAYVQEYLPIKNDLRVVVIGKEVVHAYIRIPLENEFRANLSLGAKLSFDAIPQKAIELARYTASNCGWNDVGIDICEYQNRFYVLEANMKYGKQGFYQAGIDYFQLMETLIDNGKI